MRLPLKIAANTLVQILGRFIASGSTFLITILIARQFGAEGYGDFTKIINFVALFYLVCDFGFNAVFLHQDERQFSKFLTLRFMLSLGLVITSIVISLFLPFNKNGGFTPYVKMGILIYSFSIIGQGISITANSVFQRSLRYDKSTVASSVGALATLFLVLLSFKSALPLLAIIGIFVVGNFVTAAISLLFIKNYRVDFFDVDFNFIKKIVGKTWPIGLTLFFNLIYFRADWFILTVFRSTQEVGIYGLAYKFFEFPLSLPIFFMNSLYPIMLVHIKKGRKVFVKTILISSIISVVVSIATLLFLFFMAPMLVLIKNDFYDSILPFRILVLSLPFFFLSSLLQWVMITLEKQKVLALIYFLSMVLNIVLNLLFIPRFGYIGASITTGVSEFIVLILLLIFLLSIVKNIKNGKKNE